MYKFQSSEPDGVRPWKTLSSSIALSEKWFHVRKDTVELPSGRVVDDYFVWESPHIVIVVAVTLDDKFVVVRQYRHAIGKILYQFPAGAVDQGESVEAAAKRELEEEAGYIGDKFIHLGTVAPYSTKLTGVTDVFLAPGVSRTGSKEVNDQEESEVGLMSMDELLGLVTADEMHGADLMIGFMLASAYLRKTT